MHGFKKPGLWILPSILVGASLFWFAPGRQRGAAEEGTLASRDPRRSRMSEEGDPGWAAYRRYCIGCHGDKGDGNGPAAIFLFPRPRDFTKGVFKFASTPSGSLPLDEDLLRTITRGLHGTSMPGWSILPEEERLALVRTVKRFSTAWREFSPSPAVAFHKNPFDLEDPADVARAVEQGERVYHVHVTCWVCHASYVADDKLKAMLSEGGKPPLLRPDVGRAVAKPDVWGQEIEPPDFPRTRLKSVENLTDLYRVLIAGVGGTAMPSWEGALKPDEIWALTLYLDSIRRGGSIRMKK